MIVAIVAVVIACAGTATAARVLITSSKQVARGSITSGDLANRKGVSIVDLTPRARLRLRGEAGPRGPEGARGAQGPQGARGAQGPAGANGADGSAIAYAYVNPDGSFVDSKSKGVASVAKSSNPAFPDGVYCFDLVPAVRNAIASIDFATTMTFTEEIYLLLPGTGSAGIANLCPAAQQDAAALIADGTMAANLVSRGFWISFN
jgi:Collagen triple helix repeat (20 copies)